VTRELYLFWDGMTPAGVVSDWPEACAWLRLYGHKAGAGLANDRPQDATALEGKLVAGFLACDALVPASVRELLLAVLSRPEEAGQLWTDPASGAEEAEWQRPPSIPERAALISREEWEGWPPARRRRAALLLLLYDALVPGPDEDEEEGELRRHRLLAALEALTEGQPNRGRRRPPSRARAAARARGGSARAPRGEPCVVEAPRGRRG
jgi:hypothetical protein